MRKRYADKLGEARYTVPVHLLLEDPWVAAKIDAAIAPYRHRLTKEQVDIFRQKMAWTLATHPAAARLLRAERPQAVDNSGERDIGAPSPAVAEHVEPAPQRKRGRR